MESDTFYGHFMVKLVWRLYGNLIYYVSSMKTSDNLWPAIKSYSEGPSPEIIRWEIIFCAKSPTLGDINLSNRPWGSGWGTEWGILVALLNSYGNTI